MIDKNEFVHHFVNSLLLPNEKDKDRETLGVLEGLDIIEKKKDPQEVISLYKGVISELKENGLAIIKQMDQSSSLQSDRIRILHNLIDDSIEKFGSIASENTEYVQVCKEMHSILNSFKEDKYPYALIHDLKENIKEGNSEEVIQCMKKIMESHGEEFLAEEVNPFLLAMEADEEGMIANFFDEGFNPNLPKENPPILQALSRQYVDVAELLIRQGKVELNVINENKQTPLSLCLLKIEDPTHLFKLMLSKGADPNYNLEQGLALRLVACRLKNEPLIQLLYVEKAYPELIEKSGHLLLNMAIDRGNDRLVNFLIDHGKLDFNLPDETSENALFKAVEKQDYLLAKRLIDAGADVNTASSFKEITPLVKALAKEDEKMVNLLLEKGVDPFKSFYLEGVSPYYSLKIVKLTDEKKFELYAKKFIDINKNVKSFFHHERLLKELGHSFEIDMKAKIKLISANYKTDLPVCNMPGMKEAGPMMLKRLSKMLKEPGVREILDEKEIDKIQEMISRSEGIKDPQEIMELIEKGQSVVVPTGYSIHSAFFIFDQGRVFHCDRSVAPKEKVIHLYEYDKEKIDVEIIKKIMNLNRGRGDYLEMVEDVEKEMGCKPLNCSDYIENGCILGPQKVGNCAFASSVTVISTALTMMAIEKEGIDLEKAEEKELFVPVRESQDKVVNLVRWMQVDLLEKYLQETVLGKDLLFEPDHELIRVAFGLCLETNKKDPENKFSERIKNLEQQYVEKLDPIGDQLVIENFKMEKIHHENI